MAHPSKKPARARSKLRAGRGFTKPTTGSLLKTINDSGESEVETSNLLLLSNPIYTIDTVSTILDPINREIIVFSMFFLTMFQFLKTP